MIIVERRRAVYLGAAAHIIQDDRELAWAEKHVTPNPDLKWILGNFVEADRANDNGHIFPLDDLKDSQRSIPAKPLNMLHRRHQIVGNFVAAELVYPTDGPTVAAGENRANPHVEALSAFYRYYFPELYKDIEAAHDMGQLWYSMETVPETVGCVEAGCGLVAAYAGRHSDTYCDHMNAPGGRKRLNRPHFTGGGLIVPPVRPGWKQANTTELSQLIEQNLEEAELAYDQIATEFPHLSPKEWESMMAMLVSEHEADVAEQELARNFSEDQRKAMATQGTAMPDGSYPIANTSDLKDAIQAFGRAKDKAAAKAHIIRRAKALGATSLLPDDWK